MVSSCEASEGTSLDLYFKEEEINIYLSATFIGLEVVCENTTHILKRLGFVKKAHNYLPSMRILSLL